MIDISNLSPEIEKFEDKWIAIDESDEKIVGVGDNALEATADAEQHGYQETILFNDTIRNNIALGRPGAGERSALCRHPKCLAALSCRGRW